MQTNTKSNRKKLIMIITAVAATVLMFICSSMCPYLSDDWHFFFVWEFFDPLSSVKRVESMDDIIVSIKNYYNLSGGRAIAHFLTYCVLTKEKLMYNILNSMFFTAFCWLVHRIANTSMKQKKVWTFPLTVLMSFCLIPMFGDNMLWISGSVNYLWMSVPFLGCIDWLLERFEKSSIAEKICVLPLFIFSSATNEITGGMIGVAIILYIIIKGKKSILWLIGYLAAIIPGMCFVVLAPGNSYRRESIEQAGDLSLNLCLEVAMSILGYLYTNCSLLIGIVLFALCLRLFEKDVPWRERLYGIFPFIVGFSGIGAISLTGFLTSRPLFWGIILFIPSALASLDTIIRQFIRMKDDLTNLLLRCFYSFCFAKGIIMIMSSSYYSFISLILGVLLIAAPFVIMKIKIKGLDDSEKKLQALAKKLKVSTEKFVVILMAVMSVITAKNLYDYSNWSRDYNEYIDNMITLCKEGELETAVRYTIVLSSGYITPLESPNVRPGYQIEWIAAYYGTVTKEFVLDYSPTNKEKLIEMMEKSEQMQ